MSNLKSFNPARTLFWIKVRYASQIRGLGTLLHTTSQSISAQYCHFAETLLTLRSGTVFQ